MVLKPLEPMSYPMLRASSDLAETQRRTVRLLESLGSAELSRDKTTSTIEDRFVPGRINLKDGSSCRWPAWCRAIKISRRVNDQPAKRSLTIAAASKGVEYRFISTGIDLEDGSAPARGAVQVSAGLGDAVQIAFVSRTTSVLGLPPSAPPVKA